MTPSNGRLRLRERFGASVHAVGWTRREWILVALATVVGAVIRLAWQLDRPFMNDEIGTLGSLGKSYGQILTEWDTTQTQHYFLLLLRVMFDLSGGHSWGLVLIPFLCGVLTVPATALLGAVVGEPRTGVFACMLAATNPYLVSRTGMIRAYPVQIFLSAVLIWLFVLWWRHRSLGRGVAVALITLLLALMHPNSVLLFVPLAISAVLIEIARLIPAEGRDRSVADELRPWLTLVIPMAVATVATIVAYAPIFRSPQQPSWTELGPERGVFGHHPLGVSLLDDIWPRYFADDYLAWPTTILFLVAVVLIIRGRSWLRAAPLLLVVLGFFLSARGVHALHPSDNTRWLSFTLPVLLLVIAYGAVQLGHVVRRPTLTWLIVAALIATWQPNVAKLFESKRMNPWNLVRNELGSHHDPPLVIGLGHGAYINLGPPNRTDYDLVIIRSPQAWETNEHLREISEERGIYLVHLGFDLSCEGRISSTMGRIHVTEFAAESTMELRGLLFDCLFQTATSSWSAAPEMLPVYDFLLSQGRGLGRTDFQNLFVRLRDAARAQTPLDWHRPLSKRRSNANQLQELIRRNRSQR